MLNVIDFAEKSMKSEVENHELGADNQYAINYWSAYLDGARAQFKEDRAKKDTLGAVAELTAGLLINVSEYAKAMDKIINDEKLEIEKVETRENEQAED